MARKAFLIFRLLDNLQCTGPEFIVSLVPRPPTLPAASAAAPTDGGTYCAVLRRLRAISGPVLDFQSRYDEMVVGFFLAVQPLLTGGGREAERGTCVSK